MEIERLGRNIVPREHRHGQKQRVRPFCPLEVQFQPCTPEFALLLGKPSPCNKLALLMAVGQVI